MTKLLLAATAATAVILSGCGLYQFGGPTEDSFCAAWGAIVTGEIVEFDRFTLLVGEHASNRDPCRGDDLWHYGSDALEGIDGVLFDDCVISWVQGGRSTAEAESIPCDLASDS